MLKLFTCTVGVGYEVSAVVLLSQSVQDIVGELAADTGSVVGEYDGTKEGNIDTELGESVENHDESSVGLIEGNCVGSDEGLIVDNDDLVGL